MFASDKGVSAALLIALLAAASTTLPPAAPAVVQTRVDSTSSPGPGRQSPMNIAFDLPDLIVTVDTDSGGTAQLVAYKSTGNDRILLNATAGAAGKTTPGPGSSQLFWVSVGVPRLIRTADPRNRTRHRMFHFNHNGFSAYVEMMTGSQRRALAATARSKYRVDGVTDSQVVHLILSSLRCSLVLYDDAGNRYLIGGRVSDFSNYPLRLDFVAPGRSVERSLFLELTADGSDADLQFDCRMESSGKLMKTNTLAISGDQLQTIGLEEKLFGPVESKGPTDVYVTRDQMTELSSEMYATLNIVEDYQMPEVQFSEAFVDGLIKQLATSYFAHVSIDAALKSLSGYGFDVGADLQPDVIKRNAGSILKIETSDSKERIVLDKASYNEFSSTSSNSGHRRSSGLLGLLFRRSAGWSSSQSQSGRSERRSLSDQLRELNTAAQNEAQWDIEGRKVVPKSLNVARLTRAKLKKTLVFNRIRTQTFDAPFQKDFAVYTLQSTDHDQPLADELTMRVEKLQNATEQMKTQLSRVSSRAIRRCRMCFRETEGSGGQCGGSRYTCSAWSDGEEAWTRPFRDDTDQRGGGCTYQWVVQCQH